MDCSHYDFFFDNKGVCPYCKEYLVLQFGCRNTKCVLNEELIKKEFIKGTEEGTRIFKLRRSDMLKEKYAREFKEYWDFIQQQAFLARIKRNIDKAKEKSYSKNI